MTREQAISTARGIAAKNEWAWEQPVSARLVGFRLLGGNRWEVVSNAERRGCNVRIVLDDRTGAVVSANFLPR
jgi:hypothetical protein